MNDFNGLLPSEFGLKHQGRVVPITKSKHSSRSTQNDVVAFNSIPNHNNADYPFAAKSDPPLHAAADFGSHPVYDKPVYDDDIYDGIPGLKSESKITYGDVFTSVDSAAKGGGGSGDGAFYDHHGGFGKSKSLGGVRSKKDEKGAGDFDDFIPGFGSSGDRPTPDIGLSSEPTVSASKAVPSTTENPLKVFESTSVSVDSRSGEFTGPLKEINKFSSSRSTKHHSSSYSNGRVYRDSVPFDGLGKSIPTFSSERVSGKSSSSPSPRANTSSSWTRFKESFQKSSTRSPQKHSQNKNPVENDHEFQQAPFGMPTYSSGSSKLVGQSSTSPSYDNNGFSQACIAVDMSPKYEENSEPNYDIWLMVSEVPLFTQPTAAPPPSRPPPPRPVYIPKSATGSPASANARVKDNDSSFPGSTQFSQVPKSAPAAAKLFPASQFGEDFPLGRNSGNHNEHGNGFPVEELEMNSAAAAMKEAMDRAEANFRHAKEVRERENTKASRSKETFQLEKDDISVLEERAKQERLDNEREQKAMEEKEQHRLEREWDEKERERQRLERERERARQAVERATREARERAAAEARQRAERAAVGKAHAEVRERAERAAVQRAHAEARERAATEAKQRAEKAVAEAKERAEAEAKVKAERAAVARVAAEARERAAVKARERAAAAARTNQQKNENDLESFFSMGARANSAPRPSSSESVSDSQFQPDVTRKSTDVSSSMKKASPSSTNIVDDLSSIFGAAPSSSGEFQDIVGETEERRRARLERHQRAQERAAKALAEKNQRDLQTQIELAERNRLSETLDFEVKRWAAGKEGNLRALLSTLQYVLWPECGWQPVSLTDLITGAHVKKAYRKATLCIHPDKVQQKGATLQQKYIAEKVFDLLKEAWNKFNSEELF